MHDRLKEFYARDGFVVASVFTHEQEAVITRFALNWIYGLMHQWVKDDRQAYPLDRYHVWSKELGIPHEAILRAHNRHCVPAAALFKVFQESSLARVLNSLGLPEYKYWDEGLGWLAFRLIRPSMNDGYPFSKKSWGPAPKVVSCWIPVVGRKSPETLALVPGSHLHEQERYLPVDTKFCKDEYRLCVSPVATDVFRPVLAAGEIILFSPEVLHSEDIEQGERTRFNLELRIQPLSV